MAIWQFADTVSPARAAQLLKWNCFDDIISEIVGEAIPAHFEWEPLGKDRLKGCHRAAFSIRVSPAIFDAFFNAPAGYRGQYAESQANGESANRRLLSALRGLLADFARDLVRTRTDVLLAQVDASLQAHRAKVWIDETGFEDKSCETPAIRYEPWERNDPNGAGLRAPTGTVLQVKGGWLDDVTDAERFDPWKDQRSYTIHMSGDV